MHRQTRDLTEGRPLPLLVSFSLPLMVGNVFQQMYTVVDTAVVGKALGVGALAALGAAAGHPCPAAAALGRVYRR